MGTYIETRVLGITVYRKKLNIGESVEVPTAWRRKQGEALFIVRDKERLHWRHTKPKEEPWVIPDAIVHLPVSLIPPRFTILFVGRDLVSE